jgi:hypothetical protein
MSEVKSIQIPLAEFGQQRFIDWLRERVRNGETSVDRLAEAARLPYTTAIEKFADDFAAFAMQTVDNKIKLQSWEAHWIEIAGKKCARRADFRDELRECLLQTFKREYGIGGMVPPRLVSGIISEANRGIKDIQRFIHGETGRHRYLHRHTGRVSREAVRIACSLCRELEGLINLLIEIAHYISKKSLSELNIKATDKWSKKTKELESFPEIKPLPELREMIVGSPNPCSIDEEGLASLLGKIREIRNKIAHPNDVRMEDLEKLTELSGRVLMKLRRCSPMLARVAEVRVNAGGMVEVGLYLEVDHNRKHPRTVFYEDLLNIGQSIDESSIGKEAIVAPVRLIGKEYKIDSSFPLILLRDDNVVSQLHESLHVDVIVTIHYSELMIEEKFVPQQEITET